MTLNNTIDYEVFVAHVLAMRNAQKNFFATRDKNYLETSKALEKQVDKDIEVLTAPAIQLDLNF